MSVLPSVLARSRPTAPRRHRTSRALQRTGRLWLLLGAVLIGVVALHALSAHDSAGDHRSMAGSAVAAQPLLDGASAAGDHGHSMAAVHADSPTGDDHAVVAGCGLLLVLAAVLLAPGRPVARRPSAMFRAWSGRLRGPPRTLLRLTLCVERI